MRRTRLFVLSLISLATAAGVSLHAQQDKKNEVGLVLGATLTPGRSAVPQGVPAFALPTTTAITFNPAFTLGADYDRRVFTTHKLAVYGGVDFLASPFDVKLDQRPSNVINQYAFVFLTPHVRVKFRPGSALEPWLTFGGGYARFRESAPSLSTGTFQSGTNTGALQFGAGADYTPSSHLFKLPIVNTPIGFRAEVRDFLSGSPNYNRPVSGSLQNNVIFTGGAVLRF